MPIYVTDSTGYETLSSRKRHNPFRKYLFAQYTYWIGVLNITLYYSIKHSQTTDLTNTH